MQEALLIPKRLDKRAEAGNRPANDERIHFAGAFVGVNRFGVGYEAAHLVVEQDAVAPQQFAGIAQPPSSSRA